MQTSCQDFIYLIYHRLHHKGGEPKPDNGLLQHLAASQGTPAVLQQAAR
jgi:hypothetical protein